MTLTVILSPLPNPSLRIQPRPSVRLQKILNDTVGIKTNVPHHLVPPPVMMAPSGPLLLTVRVIRRRTLSKQILQPVTITFLLPLVMLPLMGLPP